MSAPPDPARIIQTGLGFWASKTLLSAVKLDLFGVLGDKALTGAELTQALALHERADPDFYDALPEGGAFVAIEALIDDARRQNAFGLMMSLNMLIEFGVAFDYTGADFSRWCNEAGFRRTEIIPLAGPSSAAVAYK